MSRSFMANSIPLDTELSIDLFTQMLRIRRVEEAIAARYSEQKMRCPVHLSIGQEAVAVGVCKAALQSDFLISNHRAHAHYLAKGGSLPSMLAEIYGKKTGCCKGRGGSMHLIDPSVGMMGSTPIVGGSLPVGAGIAFASKMRNSSEVTLLFFGEGSTEEGVFAEVLNFAALQRLPILFICENNLYSVYSPLSVRQPPSRDLCQIAEGHGILAERGDGNCVEEVFSMSSQAIDSIRQGAGPILLEYSTYRHLEHCGPYYDNHIGYRTEEEFLVWKERCPLLKQRARVQHLIDEASLEKEIAQEIEAAFLFAEQSPQAAFDPTQEEPLC